MKSQSLQQVQGVPSYNNTTSYHTSIWSVLPVCLMLTGGICAYISSWDGQSLSRAALLAAAVGSLICVHLGKRLSRRKAVFRLIDLLPWLAVWLLYGRGCLTGQLVWLNGLITKWNQYHETGLNLLWTDTAAAGIEGAAVFLTVLQTVVLFWFVRRKKRLCVCIYSLFWIELMLLADVFSPVACALLLAGMLGCMMAGDCDTSSFHVRVWLLGLPVVMCASAIWISDADMQSIKMLRSDLFGQIREFRYGKQVLPQGDLKKADVLHQDDGVAVKLWSEQEKGIYLKGFVGSTLENGYWKSLDNTIYEGENAGILKWLAGKNFDPLMQSAQYETLTGEQAQENQLIVQTMDANRYYLYAPASLSHMDNSDGKERKDQYFTSKGIRGQYQYRLYEISDANPSELTVAKDWILHPSSQEQADYCEAEAVYRDFVYHSYTTVDDGLDALMQDWFWSDYDSPNTGIYSAVEQIRKKLSEKLDYTESPKEVPEGQNALVWYLTKAGEGNAVVYASAAVQAFRSYGIPARYAEGYYIPDSAWTDSRNGMVEVTGKLAHAWVEVYFDGIGWMPVDVTPGYYYDALKLQQMVGMPDAIHKTAALNDSDMAADEIKDIGNDGKENRKDDTGPAQDAGKTSAGLAAVAVLLITVLFVVAKSLRIVSYWKLMYALNHNNALKRITAMEKLMFILLKLLGMEGSLGWETQTVDETLAQQYEQIERGEYSRVCELMEKAVYGEEKLQVFEERALYSFLKKLTDIVKKSGWKNKLYCQYIRLK